MVTPSAPSAPRWPLLAVVWVLLPLAILGTGVVSASATLLLFARHDVPTDVRPFGLGMVEVVSLAGTLLAIFSTEAGLRGRGMVAVVATGAVAVVGGWQAYGWVGALANVFLVGLVHLASEAWLELRARSTAPSTVVAPVVVSEEEAVPEAAEAPEKPAELPLDEREEIVVERPDDLEAPVHGPATLAELVHAADTRPGDRPSERALADELDVTRHAIRTTRAKLAGLTVVSA